MTKSKLNLILGVFCLVFAAGVGAQSVPQPKQIGEVCRVDGECVTSHCCFVMGNKTQPAQGRCC